MAGLESLMKGAKEASDSLLRENAKKADAEPKERAASKKAKAEAAREPAGSIREEAPSAAASPVKKARKNPDELTERYSFTAPKRLADIISGAAHLKGGVSAYVTSLIEADAEKNGDMYLQVMEFIKKNQK